MKILYFLFIGLFIKINSQMKENPIFLINSSYTFITTTNDNNYHYVITQEKSLAINKESGDIEIIQNNNFNTIDFIYIVDKSNNKYLYSLDSNIYFLINFNPFISYSENILPNMDNYPEDIIIVGSLSPNNIIYGYSDNSNSLYFLTFPQNYITSVSIDDVIVQLSCKLIENNDYFICIIIPENLNYY